MSERRQSSSNTCIEQASLRAWPALVSIERDGMVLRYASGYTKRANSATVVTCLPDDLTTIVARCETWFSQRGEPCIFRIPSFVDADCLDTALAERGFRYVDPTNVMSRAVNGVERGYAADLEPITMLDDVNAWVEAFDKLNPLGPEQMTRHARILSAIQPQRCLAVAIEHGQIVACGLAVIDDGLLGLFDLVTDAHHRGKGFGTHLIRAMLRWGKARDAHTAYLQVTERNKDAERLYRRLGFTPCYQYWYRVEDICSP